MQSMNWLATALLSLVLASCASIGTAPPEARQALAPGGKLRVGLLLGDATQVVKDSATGEMKGVGYDLGRELARRLDVPFEPVIYTSIGTLLDRGKAREWDVAFIGFTPERAKQWDFAPPHVEVEFGYLVPAGSAISSAATADRATVRIAVQERSGPDAFVSRSVKSAIIVRTKTYDLALEMEQAGKVDAIFSIKPILFELSSRFPGSHVLEDRAGVVPQALATPKGHKTGAAYAREFIEHAKADGTVKAAIERAELHGVVVAPAHQSS